MPRRTAGARTPGTRAPTRDDATKRGRMEACLSWSYAEVWDWLAPVGLALPRAGRAPADRAAPARPEPAGASQLVAFAKHMRDEVAESAWRRTARTQARLLAIPERPPEDDDPQALAEHLLDAHGDAALRLAYSYLHNRQDAEEVLMDAVLRVIRARPAFQSIAHEKSYLLRATANLAKNRIEANRLRATDELREELVADEREDLSFVWDAVRALPEAQREAIHLHYQEGYTAAEIAEIVGRKPSTVLSDLRRGREALRAVLGEAVDNEDV